MKKIIQYFEEYVKKTPNSMCICFQNQELTYAQLNDLVCKISTKILKFRNLSQKILPIYIERGIYQVACILAAWKIGMAYSIIDKKNTRVLLEKMLYTIGNGKEKDWLIIEEDFFNNLPNYNNDFLYAFDETIPIDGVASICFTSGSTGNPKGVIVTHDMYTACASDYNTIFNGNKFFGGIPLWTGAGSSLLCSSFTCGGTFYFLLENQTDDKQFVRDYIKKQNIDTLYIMPVAGKYILEHCPECLKTVILTGDLVSNVYTNQIDLYNLFGSSEGFDVSYFKIDKLYANTPIGVPFPSKNIFVIDDNGNVVNDNNVNGTLIVCNHISKGYINNPDETNKKFFISQNKTIGVCRRYYCSGDIVYYDDNHNLVFSHRNDFVINRGGQKITPNIVESIIKKTFNIKECILIPFEYKGYSSETDIALLLMYENDVEIDHNIFKDRLKIELQDYMIPDVYIKVDKLKLGKTGKILRKGVVPQNIKEIYEKQKNTK